MAGNRHPRQPPRLADQDRVAAADRRHAQRGSSPPPGRIGRIDGASRRAPRALAQRGAGTPDDTLTLLFLCCHSALSPASQVALTLRAVGGLTTVEIARAFLVPDATVAQRISRAKKTIKLAGGRFRAPEPAELPQRLAAVLQVLYLIFNEGYTATSGYSLHRADLSAEAIRLTRVVRTLLPDNCEVAGLLALMLLIDARRPARTGAGGELIPLADQDRGRWSRTAIAEGVALVSEALPRKRLGPYQLQAAIAAVHDEAPTAEDTDWREILGLYDLLMRLAPSPVVSLNHAVARAMVHGPDAGLEQLAKVDVEGGLVGNHRLDAARGHLLEMAGDHAGALAAYQAAAAATLNVPERRYLQLKAAGLQRHGVLPAPVQARATPD